MPMTPQFDHERLDVYRIQLQFIRWSAKLFEELRDTKRCRIAETLDQLDRASLSVLLNIAEGNGRRASQQRVRFFDDARGSATECAACLDALEAKGATTERRVSEGKALLVRAVSILAKLIKRFSPGLAGDEADGPSRTSTSTRTRSRSSRPPPPPS